MDRSDDLPDLPSGTQVRVAGLLVCRQAPPTAKGHAFLTLEDEGGLVNVILRPAVHQEYYTQIRTNYALVVDGYVQRKDGVTNVICNTLRPLGDALGAGQTANIAAATRGHFGR